MSSIDIVSASFPQSPSTTLATTIFELTVSPPLCNPMGNMHGGAVATLADMTTTMATAPLAQKDFWEFGGVSRTLSVTYLKPVKLGGVARVECQVRSIGRRLCKLCLSTMPAVSFVKRTDANIFFLAVIQCVIREKNSGEMLALAEHGKSALVDQTFPVNRSGGVSHL